jgi:hypothetical protein
MWRHQNGTITPKRPADPAALAGFLDLPAIEMQSGCGFLHAYLTIQIVSRVFPVRT